MTVHRPLPINAIECCIGSFVVGDPVRIRANEQLQTLINEVIQLRNKQGDKQ